MAPREAGGKPAESADASVGGPTELLDASKNPSWQSQVWGIIFDVDALQRTTEEKTHQQSQPKRPQDDPRVPKGTPWAPHAPPGSPMTPPTHRIIGITTVKHTFLKMSLFRNEATQGGTKRPQGHPRPPKGAPRCPKAPPRCPNGCYLDAFWEPFWTKSR